MLIKLIKCWKNNIKIKYWDNLFLKTCAFCFKTLAKNFSETKQRYSETLLFFWTFEFILWNIYFIYIVYIILLLFVYRYLKLFKISPLCFEKFIIFNVFSFSYFEHLNISCQNEDKFVYFIIFWNYSKKCFLFLKSQII